jgi:hypothetical protein
LGRPHRQRHRLGVRPAADGDQADLPVHLRLTISNFASHGAGGSDVIDLNGFGLSFSSLQGYTANVDGNVVITLDAATFLTINGVTTAQLQASDFIF